MVETEVFFQDDDDTIKTPTSPDSVTYPPRLNQMLGGSSCAPSDQEISVAQSSTNGSDSTWRASSLLGSDGIPWWEDKESSRVPAGPDDDAPSVNSTTSSDSTVHGSKQLSEALGSADVPTEELHASLVVLMEALKTGQFPSTNKIMSRSSRSLGDLDLKVDISDCDSSVTGEDDMQRRKKVKKPSDDVSISGERGRTVRQESLARHRRSLSNNRFVPSIEKSDSFSSRATDTSPVQPKRHSSGNKPRDSTASQRRRSFSGTRLVAADYGDSERRDATTTQRRRSFSGTRLISSHGSDDGDNERGQRRSNSKGEYQGRQERRGSTTGRRRSMSSGRLVPSSNGRSRSSKELGEGCDDERSAYEEDARRTRSGRVEHRGSINRERSRSIGRLGSGSRSRSARRLHESDDDDPSIFGDDDHHRSRSSRQSRQDRVVDHLRRRSRSSHKQLTDDSNHESGRKLHRGRSNGDSSAGSGSKQRSSNDLASSQHRSANNNELSSSRHRSSSSRHLRSRSSHRRDLGAYDADESFRERHRRSPSRHGSGSSIRRHRSRSRHMRTSSHTSEEEEPKEAVKNFIQGLLKDGHPTDSARRRPSGGGLDRRSSRRRPSGKHI